MSKKKIPSPIQKVADLRSDPCNANLGTERGVAALARSLEAYTVPAVPCLSIDMASSSLGTRPSSKPAA